MENTERRNRFFDSFFENTKDESFTKEEIERFKDAASVISGIKSKGEYAEYDEDQEMFLYVLSLTDKAVLNIMYPKNQEDDPGTYMFSIFNDGEAVFMNMLSLENIVDSTNKMIDDKFLERL